MVLRTCPKAIENTFNAACDLQEHASCTTHQVKHKHRNGELLGSLAEVDDIEREMQEAIDNNRFNMKKGICKKWENAIKTDADLKQRYAQVGRNYQAQRDFRMEWLHTKTQ